MWRSWRCRTRRTRYGGRFSKARPVRTPPLLDHLVSAGEQRWWNIEAERPSRLEVDRQDEFGRLLDRHLGRLAAAQNPSGEASQQPVGLDQIGAVADQTASRDMLTQRIDCWQGMTRRQFRQVIAVAEVVGIGV